MRGILAWISPEKGSEAWLWVQTVLLKKRVNPESTSQTANQLSQTRSFQPGPRQRIHIWWAETPPQSFSLLPFVTPFLQFSWGNRVTFLTSRGSPPYCFTCSLSTQHVVQKSLICGFTFRVLLPLATALWSIKWKIQEINNSEVWNWMPFRETWRTPTAP